MSHEIKVDSEGNITIAINLKDFFKIFLITALSISVYFLPINGLTPASRFCLMLFVAAAGLWMTEAIPPFATAIMVIVVSIYILGKPGGLLNLDQQGYRMFLNPIASPVLILFFGGFMLAAAATKHGLDIRLARMFVKPFGTNPYMVLLAVILTTGIFSMFMSNTATTAMMIAIIHPLFAIFKGRNPFKRALVLAIPFAANIGGLGTIIGTPPNAVAASMLQSTGHEVSFLKWMMIGVPTAIFLLIVLWLMLILIFRPRTEKFEILFPDPIPVTWDLVLVVMTFSVTVFLWLTSTLHGIPTAVVALLPVMIFPMFGILTKSDLKKLDWDVLILVAGGLTLGIAMQETGLSTYLVNNLSLLSVPTNILLIIVVVFSIVLSNFMSNTSAANVIIPIIVSLGSVDPIIGAIGVAFACSLAMSLPVSTPPNAIAFATNEIDTSELVKYGTLVSGIGVVVIILLLYILRYVF